MKPIYIDWEFIFKFIESLSIVIASIIAIRGIKSWQNELKWKRKYELAEEVLANMYEAHHAIKIIRSPFGYTNEGSTRIKKEGETPQETEIYNKAYVSRERFEKNKKPLTNLHTLKYRFIAIYGLEFEEHFNKFSQIVNKVFAASDEIARIQTGEYGSNAAENGKDIKKSREIIYSRDENEDKLEQELGVAKKVIEDKCRAIIGENN